MLFSKLKVRLNIASFVMLVIASILIVAAVNYFEKKQAIAIAEKKSLILLQHNLAIHNYFNKHLKPKIFAHTNGNRNPDYFDSTWMSSTYAVREIFNSYEKYSEHRYYYKEAAINARSPHNEADDFERDFIQRLNKDKNFQKTSGVRDFDGKPYYYALMRGESMEEGCMRCHSTPDKAPSGLVKAYGPARSFNRSVGEVVSAVSIHIPLAEAYNQANSFSIKLSAVLLSLLFVMFILQSKLIDSLVLAPLNYFKSRADAIARDTENLGLSIPETFTQEMNDIAGSFNKMSYRLKAFMDGLDDTIHERTKSLSESEARFRGYFNMPLIGIAINDVNKGWLDVNQHLCNMLGYTKEELALLTWAELTHPDDLAAAVAKFESLMRHEIDQYEMEKRYIRNDGTVLHVGLAVSCVRKSNGRPDYTIALVQDICDRKHADEEKARLVSQLHQAQKMESIGSLAGGVAHDFNNKLSVILGYTSLACIESDPDTLRGYHHEIRKAAEQSADLTRQLLAFARKQTITPIVLNLNETITGMLKMLDRLIGENIQLIWQPMDDLWLLKLDPSQVDQILANLCVNARDAIAKDGKITIETDNCMIDENYITQHPEAKPGDYVHLTVSDNGCGMSKETLDRIFEPFFTTKDTVKGTGLGLATVFDIVKQNNGFINVYSESGIGTTFSIYIPRYAGKSMPNKTADLAAPVADGQETILLVEDELAILNMASKILSNQGYMVLSANTATEAIRLVKANTREIDLLITDVIMPEMNGKDLFQELRSLSPNLKTIFMSGYTADTISRHGVLDEGVNFIQKPFSLPDLATKVREVLDNN